jgi:hypothetical protein
MVTVRRKRKFYPSSSRTNFQLDTKCIADLVPFSHVFSVRGGKKKICPLAMLQPKKRKHGENMVAVHR